MKFTPDKLYTIEEVQEATGLSYQGLAKWRHLNTGPSFLKLGGCVRYRGEDLNEWLDRSRVQTDGVAA